MDQHNYYFIFSILLATIIWYQHSQMTKKILALEYTIDEVDCHIENRITELEAKINELESKSDDHDSRIDDLEIKTMFMD